jgi:hypothetical protein
MDPEDLHGSGEVVGGAVAQGAEPTTAAQVSFDSVRTGKPERPARTPGKPAMTRPTTAVGSRGFGSPITSRSDGPFRLGSAEAKRRAEEMGSVATWPVRRQLR